MQHGQRTAIPIIYSITLSAFAHTLTRRQYRQAGRVIEATGAGDYQIYLAANAQTTAARTTRGAICTQKETTLFVT
jgi:hypothetical protein